MKTKGKKHTVLSKLTAEQKDGLGQPHQQMKALRGNSLLTGLVHLCYWFTHLSHLRT